MTPAGNPEFLHCMSNVLDNDIQRQIVALGRLGWLLRAH